MKEYAIRASQLLSDELVSAEAMSGGDLSSVIRIFLSSGRSAVVKLGPACSTEAEMLKAILSSGAPAPKVLAVDTDLLALEDLGADMGLTGAWSSLGRAVRALHSCMGARYGWSVDYQFGPVAIPNEMDANWPNFWAEKRLLAGAVGAPTELADRIEVLCGALPDRLPAAPEPSLLHGDLWVGNVVARNGRVQGLIDPACYYGHCEVDLAMLSLFGNPEEDFWKSYGAASEPGFGDRRAIYQLWPALVHLKLFGDSYRGLVERLLNRCSV